MALVGVFLGKGDIGSAEWICHGNAWRVFESGRVLNAQARNPNPQERCTGLFAGMSQQLSEYPVMLHSAT